LRRKAVRGRGTCIRENPREVSVAEMIDAVSYFLLLKMVIA